MSYWNQMYKKQFGGKTNKNKLTVDSPKSNSRTSSRNSNSRPLLQNPSTATTTIINTPRPRQRPQVVQFTKKNSPSKKDQSKRRPPQTQRRSDIPVGAERSGGSERRATTPVTRRRKWPSSTPRMPPRTTTRRPVTRRTTPMPTKRTTEKRSPSVREDDGMGGEHVGKIKTWSRVTSGAKRPDTTPAPPAKSTRIITTTIQGTPIITGVTSEAISSTPPSISKWVTSGSEYFVMESSPPSTTQRPKTEGPDATSSTPPQISKWVTSGSQFFVQKSTTTERPAVLEELGMGAEGSKPLPYNAKLSPSDIWKAPAAWTTNAPRATAAASGSGWETSGTKLNLGSGDQWVPAPPSADEKEWLTAENLFSSTKKAIVTTPRPKTVTNSPIVVIPLEGHQSAPKVDVELLKPLVRDPITVINFKQDPSDDDEGGSSSEEKEEYVGYFVKKLAEGTKRPKPNTVSSLDMEVSKTTGISTFRPSTESLGWPKLSQFIQKAKRPAAPGKTNGKAIASNKGSEEKDLFNRKGGSAEMRLPEPVVVTSDAIKTKWTPEVASNILKENSDWFFHSQSTASSDGGNALEAKPPLEEKTENGAQKPQGQDNAWSAENLHLSWTTNVPKTTAALSGGFWESPGAKLGSLWSSEKGVGEEDKADLPGGKEDFDYGKTKWSFEPLKDTKPEEVFEGSLSLFPEKQSNEEFLNLVRKLEAMSLMRATTTTKRPRRRTTTMRPRRKQAKPNTSVRPKEKQQQQRQKQPQEQQQGPLFYPLLYPKHSKQQRETSTSTTTTEKLPDKSEYWLTTTTEAPSPLNAISKRIGNSAAPLAGLSAATLVYGAASVLPALFGKRRRRRRRRRGAEHYPFLFRPPRIAFSGEQSSYRL